MQDQPLAALPARRSGREQGRGASCFGAADNSVGAADNSVGGTENSVGGTENSF